MVRNPSLRRRLLLFVSVPLLAVLVCGGVINYVIGLHYANKVYDEEFVPVVRMLRQAGMIETQTEA